MKLSARIRKAFVKAGLTDVLIEPIRDPSKHTLDDQIIPEGPLPAVYLSSRINGRKYARIFRAESSVSVALVDQEIARLIEMWKIVLQREGVTI